MAHAPRKGRLLVKIPYHARWGHARYRTLKGHPLRQTRHERAYARGAERPKVRDGK